MKEALALDSIARIWRMTKARQQHKCEGCETVIPHGCKYVYVNDHLIGEHRYCGACGATFLAQLEAEIRAEGAGK